MDKPQITAWLKTSCGWSNGVRAVLKKYDIAYEEKDIRELLELKRRSEAGGFVTTEKDAVNLGPYLTALEPLSVVPVHMELTDAANAVDTILGKIEQLTV